MTDSKLKEYEALADTIIEAVAKAAFAQMVNAHMAAGHDAHDATLRAVAAWEAASAADIRIGKLPPHS